MPQEWQTRPRDWIVAVVPPPADLGAGASSPVTPTETKSMPSSDETVDPALTRSCFACGQANPSGLKLTFELQHANRRSHSTASIPSRFQGWPGVVHGGIIATILDEAMVYAGMTVTPFAVTARINIRYRRPVPTDKELDITAEVTEQMGTIIKTKAQIRIGAGVMAQAEGTLMAVEEPAPGENPADEMQPQ